MPYIRPPAGITPPAPGLDREEPTFEPEEDIPGDSSQASERGAAAREERPLKSPDRE